MSNGTPNRKTRSAAAVAPWPDLITSLIILLISTAIVIFLFWVSSQYLGLSNFQHLPDFITGTYKGVWTSVVTGAAGIGLALLRALTHTGQTHPNYLRLILRTTAALFAATLALVFLPRLASPGVRRTVPSGVALIKAGDSSNKSFDLELAAPLPQPITVVLKGTFQVAHSVLHGHLDSGSLRVANDTPKAFPDSVTRVSFRACYLHSIDNTDQLDIHPSVPKSRDSIDVSLSLTPGASYTLSPADFSFDLPPDSELERAWLCAALWNGIGYFPAQ